MKCWTKVFAMVGCGSLMLVGPANALDPSIRIGDRVVLAERSTACTWPMFEKLRHQLMLKDREAFEKLMAAGMTTGQCEEYRAGETILIVKESLFSNATLVKRIGDVGEFWMPGSPKIARNSDRGQKKKLKDEKRAEEQQQKRIEAVDKERRAQPEHCQREFALDWNSGRAMSSEDEDKFWKECRSRMGVK